MTLYNHRSPLDIRCALARSVVLAAAQLQDKSVELRNDALDDAEYLGYAGARHGDLESPILFRGTPLEGAFKFGVDRWLEDDEMSNCPYCQDKTCGDPCPHHG